MTADTMETMQLPEWARWANPEEARQWVPQRAATDCFIAALATVFGNSYEMVAEAIGWPCDPETGLPAGLGRSVRFVELSKPLLRHGMSGTVLVSEGVEPDLPAGVAVSKKELRELLDGHVALLLVPSVGLDPNGMVLSHTVAWIRDKVVDAAHQYDGRFLVIDDLDKVDVLAALVITKQAMLPAPAPEVSPSISPTTLH